MITTSGYGPPVSLLAYTLSSPSGLTGLAGLGGGCNGSGRICKPSCKPGMGGRRMSTALKVGCGCSGFSGLRGLSAVSCYDDGSCFNSETSEWTYPGAEQAWNAGVEVTNTGNQSVADYTQYFRNFLLPKTTQQPGNVPVAPTTKQPGGSGPAPDEVPWPLIALLGAGLLMAVVA